MLDKCKYAIGSACADKKHHSCQERSHNISVCIVAHSVGKRNSLWRFSSQIWNGRIPFAGFGARRNQFPDKRGGVICLKPAERKSVRPKLLTDKRWRQWWLDNFVRSSFSKAMRARFMPILCEETLPWSLWLRFELEERDRLLAGLTVSRSDNHRRLEGAGYVRFIPVPAEDAGLQAS